MLPYRYPVPHLTTPLDLFMDDLFTWLDSAWFVWIAMALSIAAVVAIVSISKARGRARDRVPHYRRQRES